MGEDKYYVGWIIDPADEIEELDESNNVGIDLDNMLTVSPPADSGENIFGATDLGALTSGQLQTLLDAVGNETMGDQDVDFFKFTVAAGGTLEIDIDSPSLDSYVRLFDEAGNPLMANDDGTAPGETSGTDSYILRHLEAGTYYIGVSGRPNTLYDPRNTARDAQARQYGQLFPELDIPVTSRTGPDTQDVYEPIEGVFIRASEVTVNQADGMYTATGKIMINELIEVIGTLQFSVKTQIIKGKGEVWMRDLPILGDIKLYEGKFSMNADKTLCNLFNNFASDLDVVGMDVRAKSIKLLPNAVEIVDISTCRRVLAESRLASKADNF